VIAVSGSALPGELALHVMDTFGDVLYNLYGTTEVAWATIASPAQLRAAPGTAGTPPYGTQVRLFDEHDAPVTDARPARADLRPQRDGDGRLHQRRRQGDDRRPDRTGDVGYFDTHGRLFVSGRDDDMIVSGGENVFPREVEDLLAEHPQRRGRGGDRRARRPLRPAPAGVRRAAPGAQLSEDAVRDYVRDNLARFKVPRDVVFVDVLPRNATGKILKRELRAR
jgi:acyl-CoA synthetase (AMP-forming)/AMP-acid ligase II